MPLLAQLVFHEAQPSLCDYRQLYFSSIQECDFKSAQIFLRVLCKPEVESIVIPAGWAVTPMEVLNIMPIVVVVDAFSGNVVWGSLGP